VELYETERTFPVDVVPENHGQQALGCSKSHFEAEIIVLFTTHDSTPALVNNVGEQ
jgi:hypothetical protein